MQLDYRLTFQLFIAFIIATVVGTVSHEFGHFIVAKYLGYEAKISYGSTKWWISNPNKQMSSQDIFYIILGGPVQTLLTGCLGLLLLYLSKDTFKEKLSLKQWLYVFMSLFWLRPLANFFIWLALLLFTGRFVRTSDEIKLAYYLQLPLLSLSIITAILGGIVLVIIIFKFIPKSQSITFTFSGLLGGIAGYILWLKLLGKIIMP